MRIRIDRLGTSTLVLAAAVGFFAVGCSSEEQHAVSKSVTKPIGSAKQAATAADQRARDLAAAADEADKDPDGAAENANGSR